ncbi:hypothetical protein A6302_01364 [Methylobrevis pamukkalensis]|uniref:Uncharacterized protein n=1 Tax=Methylobrevis pamukkalensis TaxID=1439726 RepID=A0A1E3H4S3_9HYPH|nr:hypothetical protein A6302_01364 [Methylobrevis pamukkalensis]
MQPHILIVEDDPVIRQLVEKFLGESGLKVSSAATPGPWTRCSRPARSTWWCST